jgi:protein required for attachment to host cells
MNDPKHHEGSPMTQDTHDTYAAIALVDQRVAKMFQARPTQGKALDLTEVAMITNGHENEHERSRPDMMSGPGKRSAQGGTGVVGGPHMVQDRGAEAEEDRRFAREVAAWLASRPERTKGDRLQVFAPRRFMGLLREQLDESKTRHIDLKDGEYAQMPTNELRTHSALREALPLG